MTDTDEFTVLYPLDESVWVKLPEHWIGDHARRYDQAIAAAKKYQSSTLSSFAASIAILDDWSIPGMAGNPQNWDFAKIDLQIIGWVINTVLPVYTKQFEIPKKS